MRPASMVPPMYIINLRTICTVYDPTRTMRQYACSSTDRRPTESQTYHQTIIPQTLNSMLKQPARATHTPFGLDRYAAPPAPGLILESKNPDFSDKRLRGIADPNITRSSCNCEPEDGVQHLVLKNRDQPLGNGGRRTIDTIVDQPWICNCL